MHDDPKPETIKPASPQPMTGNVRRFVDISDAEEARIQAGIAADPDNPEITDAQIARLRPAAEVLPPELFAKLVDRGGRPKAAVTKVPVKLRLDPDVVEAFRQTGSGWQTRINALLKTAAAKLATPPRDSAPAATRVTRVRATRAGASEPAAPAMTGARTTRTEASAAAQGQATAAKPATRPVARKPPRGPHRTRLPQ